MKTNINNVKQNIIQGAQITAHKKGLSGHIRSDIFFLFIFVLF